MTDLSNDRIEKLLAEATPGRREALALRASEAGK